MSDQHTARKLWCLDQLLRDKRATHLDFRLGYYIASVTDRTTGEARFKQITAAEALGVTRRAIQISSGRLKELGHCDISFAPGRSNLNGYRLCLEKANVASPLEDEKANTGSRIDDQKAKVASPIPERKGERPAPKRRTTGHEKANGHSHQSSLVSIPCLIPSRAREPAIAEALGSLGASLEAKLGSDVARSWFGKAAIIDVAGDTLRLELPNKFIADRVRAEYESPLLACCSALVPSVKRIAFVSAENAA
jgi:hypothetical protein